MIGRDALSHLATISGVGLGVGGDPIFWARALLTTATPPSVKSLLLRVVAGSSLYAVALLSQRAASFILLPVNTHYLQPSDYGVLEIVEQIGTVMAFLLGMNFAGAAGYFFNREQTPEARENVLRTTLLGSAALGSIAGLICAAAAGPISQLAFRSPAQTEYLRFSFLLMPLGFLIEAGMVWLRLTDRAGTFLHLSLLRVALTIVATYVLVAGMGWRIWGVLGSSAIAITGVALGVTWLSRNLWNTFRVDRKLLMEMVRYSFPLGLGSLAMLIIHFGDRFILPRYRTLAELGLYALAYKIAMLLSLVYASFYTYWSAQIFQIAKRPDHRAVFARIFTYMMLIVIYCALGLALLAQPLLDWLTPPRFHPAAIYVPLLVLAYAIRAVGDFFRGLFLVAGRPDADSVCQWAGGGVCLLGYFWLIPLHGAWGAAIATATAFAASTLVAMVWSHRLWSYDVEVGRLLRLLVCAGIVWAGASATHGSILIAVVLLLAFPFILTLSGFLTPIEQGYLRDFWGMARRYVPLLGGGA